MTQRTIAVVVATEAAIVVSLVLLFPEHILPIVLFTSVASTMVLLPMVLQLQRSRKEAALEAARRAGFTPLPDTPSEIREWWGAHRDTRWHNESFSGASAGSIEGRPAWLFDVAFREAPGSGNGPARAGRRQSVLLVRWEEGGLPSMRISPQGWRDRIALAFGATDIDFDEDPDFSEAFRVRTDTPEEARDVLGRDVRNRLVQISEWTIVTDGCWLAVYRPLRRLEREEWRQLVKAGRDAVAALRAGPTG